MQKLGGSRELPAKEKKELFQAESPLFGGVRQESYLEDYLTRLIGVKSW